jgi:hypothetical protein
MLISRHVHLRSDHGRQVRSRHTASESSSAGHTADREAQLKLRLKAGEGRPDNDLVFCTDDGAPYKPDAGPGGSSGWRR